MLYALARRCKNQKRQQYKRITVVLYINECIGQAVVQSAEQFHSARTDSTLVFPGYILIFSLLLPHIIFHISCYGETVATIKFRVDNRKRAAPQRCSLFWEV